jgi:hypothetical protein
MISALFAVGLLAAAADPAAPTAGAAPAASAPAKSATPAKADKNELVCKREAVLGSRMKQRTCRTQADWDLMKQEARDEVEKNQSVKPLSF